MTQRQCSAELRSQWTDFLFDQLADAELAHPDYAASLLKLFVTARDQERVEALIIEGELERPWVRRKLVGFFKRPPGLWPRETTGPEFVVSEKLAKHLLAKPDPEPDHMRAVLSICSGHADELCRFAGELSVDGALGLLISRRGEELPKAVRGSLFSRASEGGLTDAIALGSLWREASRTHLLRDDVDIETLSTAARHPIVAEELRQTRPALCARLLHALDYSCLHRSIVPESDLRARVIEVLRSGVDKPRRALRMLRHLSDADAVCDELLEEDLSDEVRGSITAHRIRFAPCDFDALDEGLVEASFRLASNGDWPLEFLEWAAGKETLFADAFLALTDQRVPEPERAKIEITDALTQRALASKDSRARTAGLGLEARRGNETAVEELEETAQSADSVYLRAHALRELRLAKVVNVELFRERMRTDQEDFNLVYHPAIEEAAAGLQVGCKLSAQEALEILLPAALAAPSWDTHFRMGWVINTWLRGEAEEFGSHWMFVASQR